jgi:hypothetical protein
MFFLSVRDRASLIDVLNENQRMQQWKKLLVKSGLFGVKEFDFLVASVGFHLIHQFFFMYSHINARIFHF